MSALPVYTLTCICSVEYAKRVEPVFEIIAEPNHFRRWMPGWLRSVGSGPLTWMLSNATSTTWINQHQRMARQGEDDAAQTANVTKEKRHENQSDQRLRGRPGQGPALLYAGTGLCQEDRFQSGPISLADRCLARGAGRH